MVAQSRNQAWLAGRPEAALEPGLPICDPHHHLWDFRKGAVQERYLLDEIRNLRVDELSPMQALQELYRLRQQLTDRK